jgi:hypothetical protein
VVPMATYEQLNFEQIAVAIGMDVGQIAKHANLFEAAARVSMILTTQRTVLAIPRFSMPWSCSTT